MMMAHRTRKTVTADQLARLAQWSERKPVIAIMGEFSAGKSTLLNMLLGEEILPMQVTATKLPPVWLRHGDGEPYWVDRENRMHAVSMDDLTTIPVKEARYIRIYSRAEVLESCDLLDTPGISDPNIPMTQWIRTIGYANAVLWCTYAAQAWRESERATWEALPERLRGYSLLLVTKADKIVTDLDRAKIDARLRRETENLFAGRLFLSLTDALRALETDNADNLWTSSGAEEFIDKLAGAIGQINAERAQMLSRFSAEPEAAPRLMPRRVVAAAAEPAPDVLILGKDQMRETPRLDPDAAERMRAAALRELDGAEADAWPDAQPEGWEDSDAAGAAVADAGLAAEAVDDAPKADAAGEEDDFVPAAYDFALDVPESAADAAEAEIQEDDPSFADAWPTPERADLAPAEDTGATDLERRFAELRAALSDGDAASAGPEADIGGADNQPDLASESADLGWLMSDEMESDAALAENAEAEARDDAFPAMSEEATESAGDPDAADLPDAEPAAELTWSAETYATGTGAAGDAWDDAAPAAAEAVADDEPSATGLSLPELAFEEASPEPGLAWSEAGTALVPAALESGEDLSSEPESDLAALIGGFADNADAAPEDCDVADEVPDQRPIFDAATELAAPQAPGAPLTAAAVWREILATRRIKSVQDMVIAVTDLVEALDRRAA